MPVISQRQKEPFNISLYILFFIVQNKCEGSISDGLYQSFSAAESVRMPVISQKQKQPFNISLYILFFYSTKQV